MKTRCPACKTTFRVRAEQLEKHNGKVRCGKCYAIFNAAANKVTAEAKAEVHNDDALLPNQPVQKQPPPLPPRPGGPRDAIVKSLITTPTAKNKGAVVEKQQAIQAYVERLRSSLDSTTPQPPTAKKESTKFEEPLSQFSVGPVDLPDIVPDGDEAAWRRAPAKQPEQWPTLSATTTDAAETPSQENVDVVHSEMLLNEETVMCSDEETDELRPDEAGQHHPDDDRLKIYQPTTAPPPSTKMRTLFSLLAGLLIGALIAQLIYLYRADIARNWPSTRPWLEVACKPLSCDIPLPQDASLIRIKTSDLEVLSGHVQNFVLHAYIFNDAKFAQAYPHLELTLTDPLGRPLARRVFAPEQWQNQEQLSKKSFLPQQGESVRINFETEKIPTPSGFKIDAFYP